MIVETEIFYLHKMPQNVEYWLQIQIGNMHVCISSLADTCIKVKKK